MKIFFKIFIPLMVLCGGIFGDVKLAKFVFSVLPVCAWTGLLKVGVVLAIISLTAGIIIALTLLVGMFINEVWK